MKHNKSHYKGAIYHVMLRGNNKQKLFFQMEDYEYFIERLIICIEQYQIKVHLFCLMTNHVHLVIEVNHIPLSKVMQSLQVSFTLKINHRHNRCGHLSQGRFVSKLIQNEKYLLELCYYIHNNPVKASMVKSHNDYHWSSHHAYTHQNFSWVYTTLTESLINKHANETCSTYLDFIYDRESSFSKPEFFQIGDEGNFIVSDEINKKIVTESIEELQNLKLEVIVEKVCKQFHVELIKLNSESCARDIVMVRSIVAYIGHYFSGYYLKDIAHYFGRNHESFSRTMHKNLVKVQQDPELKKKLDRTLKILSCRY